MKIKTLVVVDEAGKEYAFTHRSLVENKEYNPNNDPEVQGTGLEDINKVEEVEPKKKITKKKK